MRQCGDCSLCCKLLPVKPLGKGANQRCKYQRHSGCQVYDKPGMPAECSLWNCRWLVEDAGAVSRPDRTHYVLDVMPDFIEAHDHETGQVSKIEVVQVWVDPKYPEAWKDPALLDYLDARGREGKAALIRYNESDAFTLLPPAMCSDGQFHNMSDRCQTIKREHSFSEIAEALSALKPTLEGGHRHGQASDTSAGPISD